MKILVIGDEISKSLWDYFKTEKLKDIDLILSCGDLPAEYLSFLVTFANCPLLYIHGNHDEKYKIKPPEGCICIEDTVYDFRGIRILGLGGSMEYVGGEHQYTEKEMKKRYKKVRWKLRVNHGFDILLTHAPVYQIDDQQDLPHQGFKIFRDMLDKYRPAYMVHGHVHMNYGYQIQRRIWYQDTEIINGFEKYVLEIDESQFQKKDLISRVRKIRKKEER